MAEPTHYEVLSLPKSLLEESSEEQIPQIIKQAYHRALLRHHPDKAQTSTSSRPAGGHHHHPSAPGASGCSYTVDQISRAYATLSSPASRSQYDRHLLTQLGSSSKPSRSAFQTGIETIDLDDLEYSEEGEEAPEGGGGGGGRWHRSCRCGNEQGFTFGEEDLEEAGDLGELIVGCQDCSLWLRVCFAVAEDDDDEGAAAQGQGYEGAGGQEAVTKQPG